MQAVMKQEPRQSLDTQSRIPARPQAENWLFRCDRCGQPITYDEPLQVNCARGETEITHLRCPR